MPAMKFIILITHCHCRVAIPSEVLVSPKSVSADGSLRQQISRQDSHASGPLGALCMRKLSSSNFSRKPQLVEETDVTEQRRFGGRITCRAHITSVALPLQTLSRIS